MRVSASLSWWMPASILSTIPTITTCTTYHHLFYLTKYDYLKFSIAPEIEIMFWMALWSNQAATRLTYTLTVYMHARVCNHKSHRRTYLSAKNALIYPLKVQNWCCDLNILGDIGQRYGCWCPGSLTGSTTSVILSMLDKRIVFTRIVCCMYTSL